MTTSNDNIVQDTVVEWFAGLDYEYMVCHIIVCYGLYYSSNMRWIVEWFSPVQKKGRSKAVWVIGGALAIIEIIRFFPLFGKDNFDHQKFISIFHSYIVIQVFVEEIVERVHHWINILKGNKLKN